jgi:hypothetical protein
MMFGNPAIFAVEAYHERPLDCDFSGVLGRMCVHIRGRSFGYIAEPCCALDNAFDSLTWIMEHSESLDHGALADLRDFDLFEFLDAKLYRDTGQSLEEMRSDGCHFGRFTFLTNWGEQFDGAPKCFIVRRGSNLRVVWKDSRCRQRAVEIPVSVFTRATREATLWYREQNDSINPAGG